MHVELLLLLSNYDLNGLAGYAFPKLALRRRNQVDNVIPDAVFRAFYGVLDGICHLEGRPSNVW